MTAVFDWANRRIGFDGELPARGEDAIALVRRVFPGFDEIAPVIRELLIAPEGLIARLSDNDRRQRTAMAVVAHEAPELDGASTRRVAAVVQLLTAAATWQSLRDCWDMAGEEAAETAALALDLLLDGARARTRAGETPRMCSSWTSCSRKPPPCDGSVDDLGAFHSLWFDDPDGMRVELTVIVDHELRGIHEPRPLVLKAGSASSSTR